METAIKQPTGYYLNSGPAPARVMMPLLISAVHQWHQAGLRVVATVCHLGETNTELYKDLAHFLTHFNVTFGALFPFVRVTLAPVVRSCTSTCQGSS